MNQVPTRDDWAREPQSEPPKPHHDPGDPPPNWGDPPDPPDPPEPVPRPGHDDWHPDFQPRPQLTPQPHDWPPHDPHGPPDDWDDLEDRDPEETFRASKAQATHMLAGLDGLFAATAESDTDAAQKVRETAGALFQTLQSVPEAMLGPEPGHSEPRPGPRPQEGLADALEQLDELGDRVEDLSGQTEDALALVTHKQSQISIAGTLLGGRVTQVEGRLDAIESKLPSDFSQRPALAASALQAELPERLGNLSARIDALQRLLVAPSAPVELGRLRAPKQPPPLAPPSSRAPHSPPSPRAPVFGPDPVLGLRTRANAGSLEHGLAGCALGLGLLNCAWLLGLTVLFFRARRARVCKTQAPAMELGAHIVHAPPQTSL